MRTLLALFTAGLLAACGPAVVTPTVISKEVWKPCQVNVPSKPVFPADTLTGDEDIFTQGKTLWADMLAREVYELQIETTLAGCTAIAPNITLPR